MKRNGSFFVLAITSHLEIKFLYKNNFSIIWLVEMLPLELPKVAPFVIFPMIFVICFKPLVDWKRNDISSEK